MTNNLPWDIAKLRVKAKDSLASARYLADRRQAQYAASAVNRTYYSVLQGVLAKICEDCPEIIADLNIDISKPTPIVDHGRVAKKLQSIRLDADQQEAYKRIKSLRVTADYSDEEIRQSALEKTLADAKMLERHLEIGLAS